jgi:predicted dinucleotide-binding enzyme
MKEGEAPILMPIFEIDTSLAEQIEKVLSATHVVKTLNTVTAAVTVDPNIIEGEITAFLSGNDAEAERVTKTILHKFGWSDILDLGDITTARGPEMYFPLWLRIYFAHGHTNFGIKVVR